MDLDGSLQIEWDEWRQFHLLNPHAHNIKDILKFWKHATVSVLLAQNLFLKSSYKNKIENECKTPCGCLIHFLSKIFFMIKLAEGFFIFM